METRIVEVEEFKVKGLWIERTSCQKFQVNGMC